MANEITGFPQPDASSREQLDSWKEIAAYLKCSERTVRRWEAEGLPVHRHTHKTKAGIYAYKGEIDAWWQQDRGRLEKALTTTAQPVPIRPWRLALLVLGAMSR